LSSTVNDLYPTRGESSEVVRRKDPVPARAMANPLPGPLTEPDLRFFGENGFLVLERYLEADAVAQYTAHLQKLTRKLKRSRAAELVRDPATEELTSVYAIHESDPDSAELARDPRLVAIVSQILQTHVYIHQSRLEMKRGFSPDVQRWRSEFEAWHAEDGMPRMRALSAVFALDESTPAGGPRLLIPGSHRDFVSCLGKGAQSEPSLPDEDTLRTITDRGGLFSFTAPVGSLILLDCNLMCASGPSLSPYPRTELCVTYNSVKNTLVDPFCGLEPRPEYIASRKFDPLEWTLVR